MSTTGVPNPVPEKLSFQCQLCSNKPVCNYKSASVPEDHNKLVQVHLIMVGAALCRKEQWALLVYRVCECEIGDL